MGEKESQLTVRWLACFHLANEADHRMSQGAAWGHLPPPWGSPHWFATQPWLFHMFRCHWGNFSLGKTRKKRSNCVLISHQLIHSYMLPKELQDRE